ncbi:formyl transferase [Streptomyces sp. NPDC059008]|uniref:formyl transferase n=1 Tax=Streptomyces sp. NPDC059008 TaxID=3346693 RepID=UPI0036C609AE
MQPLRILLCIRTDLTSWWTLNSLLPHMSGHTLAIAQYPTTTERPNGLEEVAGLPEVDDALTALWLDDALPNEVLFPTLAELPTAPGAMAGPAHLASRHGAALRTVADLNTGPDLDWARAFAPDVLISLRFGQILRSAVIDLPPLGCFNAHSGDLPHYAGLFCPVRAVLAGERKLGCTLHRIDTGIDTGPVVARGYTPIDPTRSLAEHYARVYALAVPMICDLIATLVTRCDATGQPQDTASRQYGSQLTIEEITALHNAGMALTHPRDFSHYLLPFLPGPIGAGIPALATELVARWHAFADTLPHRARTLLQSCLHPDSLALYAAGEARARSPIG